RLHGMQEVSGSIPLTSTKQRRQTQEKLWIPGLFLFPPRFRVAVLRRYLRQRFDRGVAHLSCLFDKAAASMG
ncbi:hypothetical protein, partial [Trinickia soli]|uniref:hypothetical protein n=1 Tax=Trinickia soli TaxID=380675 RepID=UPI003FA3D955